MTARIGAAKADRFPKLTITGILGVASPQFSRLIANETSFGVAGPSLAGPLLNAQILGFQQEAVEAQARQALAQYEQSILVAFREVENALVAVRTAREQRECTGRTGRVASIRLSPSHAPLQERTRSLSGRVDRPRNLFEAELSLTSTHQAPPCIDCTTV